MSANIEVRNGKASFVASAPAWHGLGQIFDHSLTTEEAFKECGADFEVVKRPIIVLSPEMERKMQEGLPISGDDLLDNLITGKNATFRTDVNEWLGVVSSNYGIVQNQEAFAFMDKLCCGGTGAPIIESAGILGRGERVFITAKFPEPIRLGHQDEDNVNMYIVFTTSHDGTGSVTAMATPIRVVCQNTLNAAFSENRGRWNVRHTSNASGNLEFAQQAAMETLGMAKLYETEFKENIERLKAIKVSDQWAQDVIAKALLTPANYEHYIKAGHSWDKHVEEIKGRQRNLCDNALNALYTGKGQNVGEAGTGLWLFNGITTYFDNERPYMDADARFVSIMDKTGMAFKASSKVRDLILENA